MGRVLGGSGHGPDRSELVSDELAWERSDDDAWDDEMGGGTTDNLVGSTDSAGGAGGNPNALRPVGELTN